MSSAEQPRWPRHVLRSAPGARVTRLELFYDLVFVFAFLNVTTLTAEYLRPQVLVYVALVLTLLWWAWTGFAALGNVVRADQGLIPLVGAGTMGGVFVMAVAMPQAFVDRPGGLYGPLVFAAGYFLVRGLQALILVQAGRAERMAAPDVARVSAPVLVSTGLILTAAVLPHHLVSGNAEFTMRFGFWVLAIAVEYLSGALLPATRFTLVSAGHWAERHALIVLVALGESVISLGVGPNLTAGFPITWQVLVASMLGIAVIAELWWAYFDTLALAVEQVLHRTHGRARTALARDAYTYLHLPMVAGIILFALGLKKVLADIAKPETPDWGNRLGGIEIGVLYGGAVLYLLALIGLAVRALGRLRRPPLIAVVLLVALLPVAVRVPALVALALLAAVGLGLAVYQVVGGVPTRQQIREAALEEQVAFEADQTAWRRRHL